MWSRANCQHSVETKRKNSTAEKLDPVCFRVGNMLL